MRLVFALSAILVLAHPADADTYVYISIAGEKKIAVYAMHEETGKLTHKHDVDLLLRCRSK